MLCVCVVDVIDVVFSVCIVRRAGVGALSESHHHVAKPCFFSFATQFFAVSLNLLGSSKVQGYARREHRSIRLVVSGPCPHSHVVSPS